MKTIIGVLLAFFCIAASAQGTGLYVGGSLGQSRVKIDTGAVFAGTTANGITTNETDTGFKIFAGYKFHPNFAAEVAYINLGEFSTSGTVTAVGGTPITPTRVTETFKTSNTFSLSGLGILPIHQRFSLFGKLGLYSMKMEATATAGNGGSASSSDTSSGLLYGAGLQYEVAQNVSLRAEFEIFNDVGGQTTTGGGDVALLTVGAIYRF